MFLEYLKLFKNYFWEVYQGCVLVSLKFLFQISGGCLQDASFVASLKGITEQYFTRN